MGWALVVLFLLPAVSSYSEALGHYNSLITCMARYRALVSNYTVLANQGLAMAEALGNPTTANIYALNQSMSLLNNVHRELMGPKQYARHQQPSTQLSND